MVVHTNKIVNIDTCKRHSILIIGTFLISFPIITNAQGRFFNPITSTALEAIILGIADILYLIALPFLGIIIIWAGFRIASSKGNEEQLTQAKKFLYWSIVGSIIIIGAKAIAEIAFSISSII